MTGRNEMKTFETLCEHYLADDGACGKGMPLVALYREAVCARRPEKCPLPARGGAAARPGKALLRVA